MKKEIFKISIAITTFLLSANSYAGVDTASISEYIRLLTGL